MKIGWVLLFAFAASFAMAGEPDLKKGFAHPPASARPWVYWFWLNGNITRQGITADLEAMKRVGIGGALIMEVDQGAPLGKVDFAGPEWRKLFQFVMHEANRLGIEINMNDDAGWDGSGGPWITPENSMKKVVWTEARVHTGPVIDLPQPETVAGLYKDIAVIAFPAIGTYRVPDIAGKSGLIRQEFGPRQPAAAPPDSVIDRRKIITVSLGKVINNQVAWTPPPGDWTVMRFGYTCTGAVNAPSPASGRGLECDKLSKEGSEAAFSGFVAKLITENKPYLGKTFVRTHIDSWENGSQNWTEKFREEFKKRRGYELLPYLPVLSGKVVSNVDVSERFLWDIRETISELIIDNYAGHMEQLARQHGIGLSIEGYGDVCVDDLAYVGRADEPMNEFWTSPGGMPDPASHSEPFIYEMASAAHIYGKPILGAESFTSTDWERWLCSPRDLKGLGDWEFSRGVNRLVFHRYAMQPWLNVRPGMSMGPWGLHYERTQTWWNDSQPWHAYLARCQYLLQQGQPIVDLLYLAPEGAPSSFVAPAKALKGPYSVDGCPPDALLHLARVKNGRIVFPGGMTYQALELPPRTSMTPELLRKIADLADAGAIVVGPKPTASPSLSGFPNADMQVRSEAQKLWSSGKVHSDVTAQELLSRKGIPPDFEADGSVTAAHRRIGATDVYFVCNPKLTAINALCRFRAVGRPEIWDAETGTAQPAPSYWTTGSRTAIPISFGPHDSAFVVFRPGGGIADPVVKFLRNGKPVFTHSVPPKIKVLSALWGPEGDKLRTKNVTAQTQKLVDLNGAELHVADLAAGGDPAYGVVKTLHVVFTIGGKNYTAQGIDPETISFAPFGDQTPQARLVAGFDGTLRVESDVPGEYEVVTKSGRRLTAKIGLNIATDVTGTWSVRFESGGGATRHVQFDKLQSWSTSSVPGVKYFSGTATYRKSLIVPKAILGSGRRQFLDLGDVEVDAGVSLNGHDLGIAWRAPYRLEVSRWIHAGPNEIEINVTNLWPNRMIGDAFMPEDGDRNPNGTLKQWPVWLDQGKPSPTGRYSFTSWELWGRGDKLLPSGLIGPVRLRSVGVAILR